MPSGLVSPRLSYSDGGDSNLELESRPGEIYSPRSREEEQVFSMDEQCRSRGRMVSVKWCASVMRCRCYVMTYLNRRSVSPCRSSKSRTAFDDPGAIRRSYTNRGAWPPRWNCPME